MDERGTTIFYPIFRAERYLHHECGECKHEIHLSQSAYGGCSFYELSCGKSEDVKFCPHCGLEVVRFDSAPRYIVPLDTQSLDVFVAATQEYERKCEWLYHCWITEAHREELNRILPLIEKPAGRLKDGVSAANIGKRWGNKSHWDLKKLKAEFGNQKEAHK